MVDDIPELTVADFARAIPRSQRRRILRGQLDPVKDIVALRRFTGLTQQEFAEALGISVHTLRNWEQGRRRPEGPALALLRVATRHPRVAAGKSRGISVMFGTNQANAQEAMVDAISIHNIGSRWPIAARAC